MLFAHYLYRHMPPTEFAGLLVRVFAVRKPDVYMMTSGTAIIRDIPFIADLDLAAERDDPGIDRESWLGCIMSGDSARLCMASRTRRMICRDSHLEQYGGYDNCYQSVHTVLFR